MTQLPLKQAIMLLPIACNYVATTANTIPSIFTSARGFRLRVAQVQPWLLEITSKDRNLSNLCIFTLVYSIRFSP